MNMDKLIKDLKRDEGLRLKPYRCSEGKLTIGIGRNIQDVGITEEEANILLANDILRCERDLDTRLPWWRNLSPRRQDALLNMCFNLGIGRLMNFRKMLGALERGDWHEAAAQALDSRWARQVGARANRIADIFRNGE